MDRGSFVTLISNNAKEYYKNDPIKSIIRNNHMNKYKMGDYIPDEFIKAIIVDFTNFMAGKQGIDLAMYTSDLVEK